MMMMIRFQSVSTGVARETGDSKHPSRLGTQAVGAYIGGGLYQCTLFLRRTVGQRTLDEPSHQMEDHLEMKCRTVRGGEEVVHCLRTPIGILSERHKSCPLPRCAASFFFKSSRYVYVRA